MRSIPSSALIFFFIFIFAVELVSYLGYKKLHRQIFREFKSWHKLLFLSISIIVSGVVVYSFANPEFIRQSRDYSFFYFVIGLAVLNLIPKFIFSLFIIFSYLARLFINSRAQSILLTGSFIISVGIFLIILSGILLGKNRVVVRHEDLVLEGLPEKLNGLRIVQLSDIHLGSYAKNSKVLLQTIEKINALHPDLLLFTGDIVNNFNEEMDGFKSQLALFSARYGKYAIMGNHDYGDYYQWPDTLEKKNNLALIEQGLKDSGFKLLLNQWDMIELKDTSLAIIGVENWGHRPFPQYADLEKATKNMPDNIFKILMTHDPAHWDAVVVPQTDIKITLSGHTHGGQFGVKIAGIEFSPMYLVQKRWAGLYQSDNQYLYVNRGLGTIGFPGRIEMYPEFTLLTLYSPKIH